MLSRLGCVVSAGLFCTAAYKGYHVVKPYKFKLLLRQVWKPFVAGVSILANSILLAKVYKYPIFNYTIQGFFERLRGSIDASGDQAVTLQDKLKNDCHKKRAARFFADGLYVPQSELRQDIINEFCRKGPIDATYVMHRLCGRLHSECRGY